MFVRSDNVPQVSTEQAPVKGFTSASRPGSGECSPASRGTSSSTPARSTVSSTSSTTASSSPAPTCWSRRDTLVTWRASSTSRGETCWSCSQESSGETFFYLLFLKVNFEPRDTSKLVTSKLLGNDTKYQTD